MRSSELTRSVPCEIVNVTCEVLAGGVEIIALELPTKSGMGLPS